MLVSLLLVLGRRMSQVNLLVWVLTLTHHIIHMYLLYRHVLGVINNRVTFTCFHLCSNFPFFIRVTINHIVCQGAENR